MAPGMGSNELGAGRRMATPISEDWGVSAQAPTGGGT
jgi:hypothetical protein